MARLAIDDNTENSRIEASSVVVDEELEGAAAGVADDEVQFAAGGSDEAFGGGEGHVAAAFEAGDL